MSAEQEGEFVNYLCSSESNTTLTISFFPFPEVGSILKQI